MILNVIRKRFLLKSSFAKAMDDGAVEGNWTLDLFLTKEVLYPWATTAFNPLLVVRWVLFLLIEQRISNNEQLSVERETRLELATYSLEGYRSTNWATPAYSGENRIRTCEDISQQIYSLSSLAAWVSPRAFNTFQLAQQAQCENCVVYFIERSLLWTFPTLAPTFFQKTGVQN